jgi:hypothetical protein
MKKYILFLIIALFTFQCYAQETEDEWQRVYLATYPRSGNHWIRYLIEEATGIATGSVYRDHDGNQWHLKTPFPWGGYCTDHGYKGDCRYPEKDDIIVIKTHYPCYKSKFDLKKAIKTIRIVRHPIDCIYSWHVYRSKKDNGFISDESLRRFVSLYKNFQNYWNNRKGIVTYKYEDIMSDPEKMLTQILRRIGYKVSHEDVVRAVRKNPPFGCELKHISCYSQEQLDLIRTELKDFLDQFNYELPASL